MQRSCDLQKKANNNKITKLLLILEILNLGSFKPIMIGKRKITPAKQGSKGLPGKNLNFIFKKTSFNVFLVHKINHFRLYNCHLFDFTGKYLNFAFKKLDAILKTLTSTHFDQFENI